jgi:hypothetical protein
MALDLLITKPACISKSVAIQCINDLQYLQAKMREMEESK